MKGNAMTGKYRSEADFTKSVRGQRVKAYLNERGFWIFAALASPQINR